MRPVPPAWAETFGRDAFDWLAKYADHDPDWPDACLAVLSGHDEAGERVDLRSRVPHDLEAAEWNGYSARRQAPVSWVYELTRP